MNSQKYQMIFPEGYVKPLLPKGKLWVAALRSGNFSQGTSFLCTSKKGQDRHCCLGVWCEVNQYPKDKNATYPIDGFMVPGHVTLANRLPDDSSLLSNGYFPDGVSCVMGGDHSISIYSFFSLNDEFGFTFKEIADVAEEIFELGD